MVGKAGLVVEELGEPTVGAGAGTSGTVLDETRVAPLRFMCALSNDGLERCQPDHRSSRPRPSPYSRFASLRNSTHRIPALPRARGRRHPKEKAPCIAARGLKRILAESEETGAIIG